MTRQLPGASRLLVLAVGLMGACTAQAAALRTLVVDLAPKIDAAVAKQDRFAVDVPHIAGSMAEGDWERANGQSIWRYSVRIPTAVSMSFHAGTFKLPGGASLLVSGTDGTTFTYSSADGGRGELWSRIHRGDTLHFELRVTTLLEPQVDFAIASLQAGYRGIGGGAPDHPHFKKLVAAGAAAAGAVCTENFACQANAANSGNGDATAAIVIGGVAMCSATLINNLRNDATPYLLTARHCQDTPFSGVVTYWDAVTPCGTPLGSIYDTQTTAYIHNSDTAFEQQDVWLIRLSQPPNGTHVYFAGWDVTGGTFIGGYSPHHALGRSRQYAGWFGQAVVRNLPASVLGVGYDSTYWGVVNSVGNVGSGASGGGLFNSDHRLVGVASRAQIDNSGEGVCPAATPPAPTSSNVTALYSSLSAVWESNSDTTSATNPVTLKMLLDPDNTGVRVSNGFEMLPGVSITSNNYTQDTGRELTLTWHGGSATSCTAIGGVTGDGWAGPRSVNGTYVVTQYQAGLTTYGLRCTDGTRFALRNVSVMWNQIPPQLIFAPSDSVGIVGTAMQMFWRATAVPCVASGGRAGDGWAGPKGPTGRQDVPLLVVGDIDYTMTCGSGPGAATQTYTVHVQTPIATLEPVTTRMRVGSQVLVMQGAYGVNCTRTGGAPDDGWSGVTGSYPLRISSNIPGTYHYTLSCTGGPNGSLVTATASMDLTFTAEAPHVTLTASQQRAEVNGFGADIPRFAIHFSWLSNIAPCQLTYDGPGNNDHPAHPQMDFPAAYDMAQYQSEPGTYEYRITCRNGGDEATATATVEFIPNQPRVDVYVDSTVAKARDQPFTLNWFAYGVSPCVASGGAPGDGWAGPQTQTSGQPYITVSAPGNYTYTMTCGTGVDAVSNSTQVNIPPPALAFEPHDPEILMSRATVLHWNGTVGNCVLTGDWTSGIPTYFSSGSNNAYSNTPGLKTFGVRCGLSNYIEASTQINFLPLPVVDITATPVSVPVNQPVTLNWTSSNAESCTATPNGTPEWSGILPTSGSRQVRRSTPGSLGFYVDCGGVVDAVVVQWRSVTSSPQTGAAPTVSLTADNATRVAGDTVTLTWTSTHAAACRGLQGVAGDGWQSALPVSGTRAFSVNAAGTYIWEINCEGAPPSASAQVTVVYSARPTPPSGSGSSSSGGGGGGGGGRIDPMLLVMLGMMVMMAAARVGRRRLRE